jgi:hypothetical protein
MVSTGTPPDWQSVERIAVEAVIAPERLSTVAMGEGVRECDGRRVSFTGEWRPMLEVAQAIKEGHRPITVSVPRNAILWTEPEDCRSK